MQFSSLFLGLSGLSLIFAAPSLIDQRQSVGVSPSRRAQIQNAFTASGVVPTLIPSINPQVEVSVTYGNKAVNLGNQFSTTGKIETFSEQSIFQCFASVTDCASETLLAPKISFNAEPGYDPATTKYSVFLVDPDVPNPNGVPVVGLRLNFLHYYISGAQPDCVTKQSPTTVTLYEPLTPASPEQHRYTFLVYREPAGYKPDVATAQLRPGFDVNAYAAKGGLKLVGGNFLREAITNGVVPREE